MNRQRRKFADYFAMGCGALALFGYYVLQIDAVAFGALMTGSAVLIWSIVTG